MTGINCFLQYLHLQAELNLTHTLPETNSSPLKMDGWKMNFLLGWPNFRGYVNFRECNATDIFVVLLTSQKSQVYNLGNKDPVTVTYMIECLEMLG